MSRELLKRALPELLHLQFANDSAVDRHNKLIDEIKKELAKPEPEPEPEPAGWLWQSDNYATTFSQRLFLYEIEANQMIIRHSGKLYPLYTMRPPMKPLTDDEIIKIGKESESIEGSYILPIAFGRAIEKACLSAGLSADWVFNNDKST